jgi:zinc protease
MTMRRITLLLFFVLFASEAVVAQVDRTTPPPPLTGRTIEFPTFHETRLANGLHVVVVENDVQPVVNLSLFIRSGGSLDPVHQAGRAGLLADLMTRGTPTRTSREIAETIEGVGGRLNASAGNDWMSVTSTVLTEHAPLAFELLSDVSLNPTIPEDELTTTLRRTLSGLRAQLGQPGAIAQRRFLGEIYGEHPYGILPTPGSVEGLTRDDLLAFHREHFAPGNALLVISGDITFARATEFANRYLGQWQGAAAGARSAGVPPTRDRTEIHLVHRPGSVQSTIWVGHLAVEPGHTDFFALEVMNALLGQGSDARLFQILREQKGWTYGAYSRITRPRDVGYFAATTEVRTGVTDSAVVEIMHQLNRLRNEEVPREEFEATKSFLIGSFPLRLETPGQIASQVAQVKLLGLDVDDLTEYRQRIAAVTPADVRRVAMEHIHPDRAAIVIVGDATQILAGLEPVAPIILYDVEGRRIERSAIEVRAAEERFDATRLQPMTLTYQLSVQGNPLGTVTQRLQRDGNDWVATTSTQSAIMGQEGEMRFDARDFTPRASTMTVTQGPMRIATELRVEGGRILGRAEMPEQLGGSRDIDVDAIDGMIFPGMEMYLLAAADLAEGRSVTVPMFDATSGGPINMSFEVTGVQEVTVPAGTFQAYRISVGGPQAMFLYVRQDAPHVMLRQEYQGQPISIELTSME